MIIDSSIKSGFLHASARIRPVFSEVSSTFREGIKPRLHGNVRNIRQVIRFSCEGWPATYARRYMSEKEFDQLPKSVQSLAFQIPYKVQPKEECHITVARNLCKLIRSPEKKAFEPPAEVSFLENKDIVDSALAEGRVVQLFAEKGLATLESRYSKDSSHSVLMLAKVESEYIVYDPDHTHDAKSEWEVYKLSKQEGVFQHQTNPHPRYMIRTIREEDLKSCIGSSTENNRLLAFGDFRD